MLIDGANLIEGSQNSNIVVTNVTVAQRTALTNLDVGEIVYTTDGANPGLYAYTGSAWEQVGASVDLSGYVPTSQKGAANGVATLDSTGVIPSAQLPSYVDDILEYANVAAFPATGEAGKIYISQAVNLTYRWTGSAYVEVSAAGGSPVASGVGFTATGNISATNVQAALAELDTEKAERRLPTGSTSGTLVLADAGKIVPATGAVTVPANVFSVGDIIILFNNTASAITVTTSSVTAYISGTNTTKTSVSLATRGVASIMFVAANTVVISGDVS